LFVFKLLINPVIVDGHGYLNTNTGSSLTLVTRDPNNGWRWWSNTHRMRHVVAAGTPSLNVRCEREVVTNTAHRTQDVEVVAGIVHTHRTRNANDRPR